MIQRVELKDSYSIVIENNKEKQETQLGIKGWEIMFTTKQDVIDHIRLIEKALEFWEYD